MTSPPPTGPPTSFSAGPVPTSPPPPPDGWQPGQPVPVAATPPPSRWGIADIVLGFVFIFVVVAGSTILGVAVVGLDAIEALADGDLSGTDAVVILGITTFGQGAAMGLWPVIVARWKGRGVVEDFGLRFRPVDIAWGLGTGFVILILAGALGALLTEALDVGSEESTNTQIISDAADTQALWIIVAAAVALAPVVEELFFRGLCLRAIEKRFGTTWAVIGSTVLFTIPHFANPSLAGTVVLFSIIGMVGLFLALLVVRTGRLGPAIIAHAAFNVVGVIGVLAGA